MFFSFISMHSHLKYFFQISLKKHVSEEKLKILLIRVKKQSEKYKLFTTFLK